MNCSGDEALRMREPRLEERDESEGELRDYCMGGLRDAESR